jgi:polygalacturonase
VPDITTEAKRRDKGAEDNMELKILFSGVSSACFELINSLPYYAPGKFKVLLDGQELYECDSNVFSVFSLKPDSEYRVQAKGEDFEAEAVFRTGKESCCVDVRSFGAKGDGVTDDTYAVQTAIRYLPDGARLIFPEGIYLTKPLVLRSHITLELEEGAELRGWPVREEWPIVPGMVKDLNGKEIYFGGFEGYAVPTYESYVSGQYIEDVAIVGKGTINGNAQESHFWENVHSFPAERGRLLFFNRCKNVTLHGIHACNSHSWQIHPYYSDKIGIYDVFISAPKDSPNTDAIDPESCDEVEIIGCRFSVGDDCIAIKSSKMELGMKLNRPADHHMIRNCLMQFGHGAVTLGSEISAGVRNLSVSHCYFVGTDRGLRIKTRRGRGKNSRIDEVCFENIKMDGVLTPFAVNMWYSCCDPDCHSEYVWSREHLPVDDRTPYLGRFLFKDIECVGAEVAACYIDGLPEAPVEEVVFENVSIAFSKDAKPGTPIMKNFAEECCCMGLYFDNVKRIKLNNIKLYGVDKEAVIADHYEELISENVSEG